MRDYAADGVQMFPTSDEPSGYNLHSVRIAGLFVREIAEVEVLTLYTPDLHSNKLEHARIRARFRGVLCPVLWCSNASAMEQVDVPDDDPAVATLNDRQHRFLEFSDEAHRSLENELKVSRTRWSKRLVAYN